MKVSVITTLYNYRDYIVPCIESFLNQDFEDSELIIVDDQSTDKPLEVIEKYLSDRVKYLLLKEKANYSVAKNVGIKNSRSEVLVMLDADDMLTRSGITLRYNKLMDGYDFVHGAVLDLKNGRQSKSKMIKEWLTTKNIKYVHAQGTILRKDIHRKIGLYDETLRSKSDREMFYRIYNHGYSTGWVGSYVAIYRKHPAQMNRSKEKIKNNTKMQKIVKKKIKVRETDLSDLEMLI